MKTDVPRVVAVVGALTLVGLSVWGCASGINEPATEPARRHYEPDGGWQSYRPAPRRYDVDPMQPALAPPVGFH